MKLIHVNGIPHWTDGELTLPIMAGAQDGGYDIPGGDGKQENLSYIGQIVYSPTNHTRQYRIVKEPNSPWPVLINTETGGKSLFPAGVYVTANGDQVQLDSNGNRVGDVRKLSQTEFKNYQLTGQSALSIEDLINGVGGGGGGPTIVGASAPDPYHAATLLMDYYDKQVQAGNLPREAALQQFNADLAAHTNNLTRAQNINQDIRERQIAESSRQLRTAEEAGSRARTVAQDILPRSIPNLKSFSLPLLGNMPVNQVNVDQLFNQGLPPLASLPGIPAQGPEAFPAPINAPVLPALNIPALPDISALVNATAGGFKGWQY